MMKKGMVVEDSMSNLTSASNDASISSGNRDEQSQPAKKRRNLPGNPDPGAEVIALSPRSLLATNRFPCEVCGKGFQRDQNLQLHRRGHNLPWKLKQRNNKEVIRKKVYVCPEVTCVHHDPSRALGDLTGIKKHFCRKHGEKKWKCEKCSKRYAVQSDWKAHSKICGTREYRCDCGTLFSRRDSFITHRAFCDALAEENARPIITANHPPLSFSQPLKREQDLQEITFQSAGLQPNFFSPRMEEYSIMQQQNSNPNNNPPNPMLISSTAMFSPPPHMSATALLQKASQMGVTMSKPYNTNQSKSSSTMLMRPHQVHMTTTNGLSSNTSLATSVAAAGSTSLDLSSREEMGDGFIHGLLQESFGNKSTSLITSTNCMDQVVHEPASFFGGSSSNFNGMLGSNYTNPKFHQTFPAGPKQGGNRGGGNEGLTRDFLGLRAFPNSARDQCDLFMAADLHHMGSSSYEHQNHQS